MSALFMPMSRSNARASPAYVCQRCAAKLRSPNPFSGTKQTRHLSTQLQRPGRSHNSCLSSASSSLSRDQRRWLTRNHIRKIAQAEEDWSNRRDDIEHGKKRSVLEMLEERGLVNQIVGTREQLKHLLDNRRTGIYAGIDPTAPSMHVGHMIPFMALSWLYVYGYPVYFLLGGATAKIGDPEGRLQARSAINRQTFKSNMTNMHMQLKRFGASMEKYAERKGFQREWAWRRALVNNSTWQEKASMSTFMKMMGTGVRVGPMLGRDSVKNRLEKGDGMNFAEFAYPLMQAWDWWELFQKGVQIQIGGADQFGNILQGVDAVKFVAAHDTPHQQRLEQEEQVRAKKGGPVVTDDPLGWTVPLLTTASGEKFGKSAGNAIWLDKDMTSAFDLYQFFLRSSDADVEKYLKLLTFLPIPQITAIMEEHGQDQSKRVAQHKLAREFVELIHGSAIAEETEKQHRNLFNKKLSISDLQNSLTQTHTNGAEEPPADLHPRLNKHAKPQDMQANTSTQATLPQSLVKDRPLSQILHSAGLVASRSEGQRLINAGGVYIGAQSSGKEEMKDSVSYIAARDSSANFVSKYIIDDNLLILRTGKWRVKVISILTDEEFKTRGLTCPNWDAEAGRVILPAADSSKVFPFKDEKSGTVGWY